MFDEKPLPLATVTPGVPALLQEGFSVKFSDAWPQNLAVMTTDAAGAPRGRFYKISATNQVHYDLSYKLPVNDFRDVDFSNTLSAFNENLYPQQTRTLYETMIGFKEANVLASFFVPAGQDLSRLEQPSMIQTLTSPTLRYLGAKQPKDSPYDDKRIYFYSVFNMEPFIMRLFIDNGLDFEKVVVGLLINKCLLIENTTPSPEDLRKAKLIRYYSELKWL